EIDVSARPLPWTYTADKRTWVCDQPPNRATVYITDDGRCWEGCLERPDRMKHISPDFFELAEALSWAEQELQRAAEKVAKAADTRSTRPELLRPETLTPEHRARLAPFWIDPAALEPEQLTYRLLIHLRCNSIRSKTMEISFGKMRRYGEEYP